MYELVHFEPTFLPADDLHPFHGEFIDAPRGPVAEPVGEERAWLISQVTRRGDLGTLKAADGWFEVRSRLEELAEADDEEEIADLRRACRDADAWRRSDYDWPLIAD